MKESQNRLLLTLARHTAGSFFSRNCSSSSLANQEYCATSVTFYRFLGDAGERPRDLIGLRPLKGLPFSSELSLIALRLQSATVSMWLRTIPVPALTARAVADQRKNRPLGKSELDAERITQANSKTSGYAREVRLRLAPRNRFLNKRSINSGLL